VSDRRVYRCCHISSIPPLLLLLLLLCLPQHVALPRPPSGSPPQPVLLPAAAAPAVKVLPAAAAAHIYTRCANAGWTLCTAAAAPTTAGNSNKSSKVASASIPSTTAARGRLAAKVNHNTNRFVTHDGVRAANALLKQLPSTAPLCAAIHVGKPFVALHHLPLPSCLHHSCCPCHLIQPGDRYDSNAASTGKPCTTNINTPRRLGSCCQNAGYCRAAVYSSCINTSSSSSSSSTAHQTAAAAAQEGCW